MQAKVGSVIHGVMNNVIQTIYSPLYMDIDKITRTPYGSTPTSLYKRVISVSLTNKFAHAGTLVPYFAENMAIVYTPTGTTCVAFPLD